jgi:multiple sugar transport system ATP-binding protein
MSVVEVKNISKRFGDFTAVKELNLEVNSGEFLVVLGPSGCGKTTLMRMIAGLEHPTSGHVWIAGQDVTALPPRLRDIAMVFQSYALYPHMTVFNNIEFPLKAKLKGLTRPERTRRVEQAATMVKIEQLLDRYPRQLSGGERQRVAIARALVTEPKILLLDEPLSNLDAKLRASARDELKHFQQSLGITTIFVTHDQIEAMGLGDRIIVMSGGEIQQIGTPQAIYDDPANEFVATFLGSPSMNLLPYENYKLGFRPESFLPTQRFRNASELKQFHYHVTRIEYLGADRLLYGYIREFGESTLTLAKIPNNIDDAIAVDVEHDFSVAIHNLRYFSRENGKRLERGEVLGV